MTGVLVGKRVVNTRAVHQAKDLDQLLRQHGAIPLPYPCIAIAPPEDTNALDTALRALAAGAYTWMVLTSANTVRVLAQRLDSLGLTLQKEPTVMIAAVGTATAESARALLGLEANLMPAEFTAQALGNTLDLEAGTRVFLPQSAAARSTLAEELSKSGARVTAIDAYRTVLGSGGVELPALLDRHEVDAIVFASSSGVQNFVVRLAAEGGKPSNLGGVCIACIGPRTAETAQEHGLVVTIVPAVHTLEGVIEGLTGYYAGPNQ
jgi:uroporphyrinogen-III synthase